MVLKEISEKYFDKEYFNKYKYDETVEKVSVHLRISPEIANEFVKVIATYRGYGIDKFELIKSDLGEVIFKNYCRSLPDDESALLNLFHELKTARDEKTGNSNSNEIGVVI